MFDAVMTYAKVIASSVSDKARVVVYNLIGIDGEEATKQEGYQALGIIGRPLPPSTNADGQEIGAEPVAMRTGDGMVPIAWRDLRLNDAFPNPKDGDLAFVGYGANFIKLGADGSVSVCATTDATADGKLIQFQVNPGSPELPGGGFVLTGPFGKITYDESGFHLLHHTGARIDLGGIGGLPAPLDQLGSYATISAAMVDIQASTITLGPDAGTPDNAAKATAVLAAFAALSTMLTSLGTALTAIGTDLQTLFTAAGLGVAPSVATIATAVTAIGTAQTAITTTATTAIPSQSTSVT